jgi:MFS family permease
MSPSDTTSPVTSPETQSISGVKDAADTSPPLEYSTAEFKPGTNFYLAFVSLCIITLAAAFDATSLSIALPIITEKLKGTAIEAFWSGTSFLVTSAVFQPVIAGMSHVFGRKAVWRPVQPLCIKRLDAHTPQMVLVSSVFFGVGSILAAVAKSFTLVCVLFKQGEDTC